MPEVLVSDNGGISIKDFLQKLYEYQSKGNFIFRGVKHISQLQPSLVKQYDRLKILDTGNKIEKYEAAVLDLFGKYCVQDIPPYSTSLDYIACAQHYGIPTRLIDWSFDPYCALFFAIDREKKTAEKYQLIVIDYKKNIYIDSPYTAVFEPQLGEMYYQTNNTLVNEYLYFVKSLLNIETALTPFASRNLGNRLQESMRSRLITQIEEEKSDGIHRLFFFSCYDSNARIVSQRGLFQIPRRFVDDKRNDIIAKDILSSAETVYTIDEDARRDLNKHLIKIGITTPKLFPDIVSKCRYISEKNPFEI